MSQDATGRAASKSPRPKNRSNLERLKNRSGSQESLIQKNDGAKAARTRQQMRARFQVLLQGDETEGNETNTVPTRKKKQRTKTADSVVSEHRGKEVERGKKARSAENLLDPHMYTEGQDRETIKKQRRKLPAEKVPTNDAVDGQPAAEKQRPVAKKGRGRALKSKDQNVQERPTDLALDAAQAEEGGKENQAYDVSPDRHLPAEPQDAARPKKKRTKKKGMSEPLSDRIVRALETKRRDEAQLLGIEVHKADRLKPDIHICHPLVRVHVIDTVSGQYVKKSSRGENINGPLVCSSSRIFLASPHLFHVTGKRNVASYYESENESIDYILPQMSQPFDFKKLRSLTPAWDELLIYNEVYSYFLQREPDDPKVVLIFELLDFLSMPAVSRKENASHNKGWYKIAWAFLKVVGADNSLNTDRKVRLQLYNIPQRIRPRNAMTGSVEVFQWWSSGERQTYPSTLYITVKGIRPPSDVPPSTRSMYPIQEERGRLTYEEFSSTIDAQGARIRDQEVSNKEVVWNRLPGQVNRIPNKLFLSLPSGRKGCSVTRFSTKGRYLACACTTLDGYPVVVYEIPSGNLHAEFAGHFGIVYDMSWSSDDQELVTASSDGTVRAWNVNRGITSCIKLYPHPSFVYAVRHHPLRQSLIVTGGYDSILRVWTRKTDDINGEMLKTIIGHSGFINSICFNAEGIATIVTDVQHTGMDRWLPNLVKLPPIDLSGASLTYLDMYEKRTFYQRLILECYKHKTTNSIRRSGNSFYSADSNGSIFEWRAPSQGAKDRGKRSPEAALVEKWSKTRTIKVDDLKGTPISSMTLHAGGKKLLLHTKNSTVQMLDLRALLVMKKYHGCINFKDHLRSTLSTCGSFVFGTSEDGWVRTWNTETGDLVYTYKELGYSGSVNDVHFHPMDNYIAFCAYGSSHPIIVYTYDPHVAMSMSVSAAKEGKTSGFIESSALTSPSRMELTSQNFGRTMSSTENLKTKLLEELNTPLPTSLDPKLLKFPGTVRSSALPDKTLDSMGLTRSTWGSEFASYRNTTASPIDPSKDFIRSSSPHAYQHLGASTRMTTGGQGLSPYLYYNEQRKQRESSPEHSTSTQKRGLPRFTVSEHNETTSQRQQGKVIALYEYHPNRADELLLKPGDELLVLQRENNDWWFGRHPDGREGYFPANYIMEVAADTTTPKQEEATSNADKSTRKQHSAVIGRDGELKIVSGPEDNEEDQSMQRTQRRRKQRRKDSKKTSFAAE